MRLLYLVMYYYVYVEWVWSVIFLVTMSQLTFLFYEFLFHLVFWILDLLDASVAKPCLTPL